MWTTATITVLALMAGCGGGSYGFARTYQTIGDEDDYLAEATRTTYEEVRRDPAGFRSNLLSWFGVVTAVDLDAATGEARVTMTFRTHRERHLCADERASSCRVTVSERPGGPFTMVATLREEDWGGQDRMWVGSLVRVYGSPNGDFDDEGGPIVVSRWYRHWPRGTFVTTGAAGHMRR